MADDIITRDSQGNLAVNTVSSTEANVPYNYDDCFTLDTNGRRALRVVGAGGGGGSVDYSKTVQRATTMPTASASNAGQQFLYSGATNATYTHGYIYENVKTSTYTDSVTFEPATLSGTVVTATAGALSNLCAEYITGDITSIVSGTLVYLAAGDLWLLTGKDAEDNTVGSFQVYTPDYEAAGFTFTGTPEDGDVVAFTCTVEEASATYAWERIDVQPAGGSAAVTSVNGKTGAVVLNAQDVSALPQVTTMPQASASQEDKIVQYIGQSTPGTPVIAYAEQTTGSSLTNLYVTDAQLYYEAVGRTADLKYDTTPVVMCVPAISGAKLSVSLSDYDAFFIAQTGATTDWAQFDYVDVNSWMVNWGAAFVSTADLEQAGFTIIGTPQTGESIGLGPVRNGGWVVVGEEDSWPMSDLSSRGIYYEGTPINNDVVSVTLTDGEPAFENGYVYKCVYENSRYTWVNVQTSRNTGVTSVNGVAGDVWVDEVPNTDGQPDGCVLTIIDGGAFWWMPKAITSAPTLAVADWSNNTQTITVSGVTATNVVIVSPAPASAADYASAGILCTGQNTDTLTFTCDAVPTNAITLSVVIL